jgi:hypothetical protein
MNNHKTYTQEEIDSNINILTISLESLTIKRKSINSDIRNVKKQILYWEELNKNQYKLFE